ncbi:hypothetical protein GOP47_0017150 [Adiantum capillus-veneris]|uniref:Pentatricopeptide repeat-containing protein n=1 Tax=Adiantum capillus-veneris TaxID=13818 RepID=A0A9D4UJ50_ADICA|nr:hypothetical protein GOP47_0017150 [Adiantum capillus-veneris]
MKPSSACYHKPREPYLLNAIKDCTEKKNIAFGRHIYALIASSGLEYTCALGDHLIRFFSTCGTLLEAGLIFCNVKKPNVYVWHAIISAHCQYGHFERALSLCRQMYHEGVNPNRFIFPSILKACGSLGNLEQGKLNHAVVTQYAFESDVVVGSSLIDMYVKLAELEEAQRVFDHLRVHNAVSWSSIIDGHAEHGDGTFALNLYEKMCETLTKPDKVIFLCVLKACSKAGALWEGLLIHDQIIKSELDADVALGNTLVDMYAKCKQLRSARKLFERLANRTVVSWGALITGYAHDGQGDIVLELYEQMDKAFLMNEMILPSVLKACANFEKLVKGKEIHSKMVKCMVEYDVVVGSSLVDMYAKCGSLEEAREVFDMLSTRNSVSWGAMIGGYMQQGKGLAALEFFKDMQQEGIEPDNGIFVFVLKACGSINALKLGRSVHHFIAESVINVDEVIIGALVDMYAKCGSMEEAQDTMVKSFKKNIALWGAVIGGYAKHGDWRLAQQSVEDMQREGTKPNQTIITSVLSACSHAGEAEEGQQFLESMTTCGSVVPNVENFTCMIDLLGSTGQLEEAVHLLETMPAVANVTGLTSLLTACKTYGHINLGKNCFHEVSKVEPHGSGSSLMSSIYARAHMWEDFDQLRASQISGFSWKKPGVAWIEATHSIEEFMVGDTTHPESPRIYASLKRLSQVLKIEGYIPTPEDIPVSTCDQLEKVHKPSQVDKLDCEQFFRPIL